MITVKHNEEIHKFQTLDEAMAWAKENGYLHVYLETMPELSNAVSMYEKLGYIRLTKSLGNSGHDGCSIWMLKAL
jgi:putative acetyltransferase